jgi:DNA-directed RNA polymerase specialized sigma24 family protein
VNNDAWPPFLDKLKSHPKQAATEFAHFALQQLRDCPPAIMHSLSESERDDIIQDVILHCTDKKLRVLRMYRDTGRPFSVWLYFIARHRTLDFLRREGRFARFLKDLKENGAVTSTNGRPGPDQNNAINAVLAKVADGLGVLDQKCRILIRYAADEYPPRDIALALGLTPRHAKKISDDLRHCRRKLRDYVESQGVKLTDLLRE